MAFLNQKTINDVIEFEGITLNKGKHARMRLLPAPPNSGIVFKRIDLLKNNLILANFLNVSDATLCTTLKNEAGVSISTVEHLMAAFYGLGVDNAIVEIDHDELPIMDGSSLNFINLINKTGLRNSDFQLR